MMTFTDSFIETWEYQGSAATPYIVSLRVDGRLSCTCRGWTMKRAGKTRSCKHTKDIARRYPSVDCRDDGEYVSGPGVTEPSVTAEVERLREEVLATGDLFGRAVVSDAPVYRPLMLAEPLPDGHKVGSYPADTWVMEKKYDGERCLVSVRAGAVTAWSRAGRDSEGRSRDGLPRDLGPTLTAAMARFPDGDYDGEVVIENGLSSDVRRVDQAEARTLVLFDVLALGSDDLQARPYTARRSVLSLVVEGRTGVTLSESWAPSQRILDDIWDAGGEGVVLKRAASTYVGRRSTDWLKVKRHDELVATIVGFKDSKANGAPNAVIVYEFAHPDDGRTITSTCKVLNADWSRRIAAGGITIGTKIEVSYQILMASGKPRHGMAKRIVGEA